MRSQFALLLILLGMCACKSSSNGTDGGGGPQHILIGDQSMPIEMMIVHRTVDATTEITMDQIPLIEPPQGGKVIFVGVRARNLDGKGVIISASMTDKCDTQTPVLALEMKPIDLAPTPDGWGEPNEPGEIINYSNLPMCPSAGAKRNTQSETFELRVKITDKTGKSAEQTINATPYCAEPSILNQCLCECQHGSALGSACPMNPDAGPSHLGCGSAGTDGGAPHDGA